MQYMLKSLSFIPDLSDGLINPPMEWKSIKPD